MFFPPQTQSGAPKAQMPTAAKLVAALLFCLVGYQAARFVLLETFPEAMHGNTVFPLSIGLIGIWQGWMVSGARAGQGWRVSLGNGMRCAAQIAFFGLLFYALRTMFSRAANMRYDAPWEAVIATFEIFIGYFAQSLESPLIWGTLLIGGAMAGLLTEAAGRLWR
ncbi:MAG: TrgA family protein [Roseicyclus sp.]